MECIFGSIDYRKFVQRNIPLPTPSKELLKEYINHKLSEENSLINNKQSILDPGYLFIDLLPKLINSFLFSLKQINEINTKQH